MPKAKTPRMSNDGISRMLQFGLKFTGLGRYEDERYRIMQEPGGDRLWSFLNKATGEIREGLPLAVAVKDMERAIIANNRPAGT